MDPDSFVERAQRRLAAEWREAPQKEQVHADDGEAAQRDLAFDGAPNRAAGMQQFQGLFVCPPRLRKYICQGRV